MSNISVEHIASLSRGVGHYLQKSAGQGMEGKRKVLHVPTNEIVPY